MLKYGTSCMNLVHLDYYKFLFRFIENFNLFLIWKEAKIS